MKLEVGLEVHLGPLLEQVCRNETLHMQSLLLLLLFPLAHQRRLRVFLEVFHFELLFLEECAIVHGDSHLVVPTVWLLLHVLAGESWVTLLAVEFLSQMSFFLLSCSFVWRKKSICNI